MFSMPSTLLRVVVLVACTFLGLVCGTLYLYLSYGPQLAIRLSYSAADSSSIGLFGSVGIALSGPIAGVVVDTYGYTAALLLGAVGIVSGYACLQRQYDAAWASVSVLRLALFLVGCGSTFINLACLKCCAVTFPRMRGVATALPLALYGLLAMVFSVAGSMFFSGDPLAFLAFLARALFGVFVVCAPAVMLRDGATTPGQTENVPMVDLSRARLPLHAVSSHPVRALSPPRPAAEVSGARLLHSPRFWLLFITTGVLAAVGQMYIYSVGYMASALSVAQLDSVVNAEQNQRLQVSLLSVANCVGRLAAGISGDMVHLWHCPRRWLLVVPVIGLLVAQGLALAVSTPHRLSLASLLTGFFYGYTFCIMPLVVGDEFGLRHFLANWGLVGLAPVSPSYYLTSLFGQVYDLRSVNGVCMSGRVCYDSVFYVTTLAVLLAAVLVALFNLTGRIRH